MQLLHESVDLFGTFKYTHICMMSGERMDEEGIYSLLTFLFIRMTFLR